MKISEVKRDFIKILITKGVPLLVLIALAAGSFFYYSSVQGRLEKIKGESGSLSSKLSGQKQKFGQAEEKLSSFLEMGNSKMPTDEGLEYRYQRKVEIGSVMTELEELYNLKNLSYQFSDITENTDYASDFYKAYEGMLTVNIAGPPDDMIFSFVEDLKDKISGFLILREVQASKNNDINEENINQYFTDDKFLLSSIKLEFVWISLKNKKQE
jgi:hypothetical protein